MDSKHKQKPQPTTNSATASAVSLAASHGSTFAPGSVFTAVNDVPTIPPDLDAAEHTHYAPRGV